MSNGNQQQQQQNQKGGNQNQAKAGMNVTANQDPAAIVSGALTPAAYVAGGVAIGMGFIASTLVSARTAVAIRSLAEVEWKHPLAKFAFGWLKPFVVANQQPAWANNPKDNRNKQQNSEQNTVAKTEEPVVTSDSVEPTVEVTDSKKK